MRSYGVNRSSISRYMGRGSGVKRSSHSVRSRYKLNGTKFQSYLEEAKRLVEENKNTENAESTTHTSSSSARTKASSYKATGSAFNTGVTAMENSVDDIAKLLRDEDGFDREKAFDAAKKYVDGYNDMFGSVKDSSISTVKNSANYINGLTGTFSRALKKTGITVGTDGKLSIDKETFESADQRDIENIFGKKSSYAELISEQVDKVSDANSVKSLLDSASSTSTYSASSLFGRTSSYSSTKNRSSSIDWFDKLY